MFCCSKEKLDKLREAEKNSFGSSSHGSTIKTPYTSTKQGASSKNSRENVPIRMVTYRLHSYHLHSLPTVSKDLKKYTYYILNIELLARIEALQSENRELKAKLLHTTYRCFIKFTPTNFAVNDETYIQASHHNYEAFLSFLSSWDLQHLLYMN